MADGRQPLPRGTRVKLLSTGSVFEISAEPIGFGGAGIIYPARRMTLKNGELRADGIRYALKECYPGSDGQEYFRDENGEITAGSAELRGSLENAKKRHTAEKERNQAIHVTANRILPILEAADSVELTWPGKDPVHVANAVSIMESLEYKGRSLNDCLTERRRFSALETCRIVQQLLFALREVHNAGYLHLDIQGGNVFLRGTLEDKSDFLTLIDFGTARPTDRDGRTEEIRDQDIFTTLGYSAPELLLKTQGPLRLSRESDLYSVGCVALLLLTGRRPVQSKLLVNRTGDYLKPNQMRLIDCPVYLRRQLQALLARALAQKPEDRFHSADEMLEAVNELLEALKPAQTVLSTVKYDAFISYRHGADSPVAKALQLRLEHFHTTDHAGKRIRPFRKVFLDEGELSATANFGQTIRDALRNSRWLLVVCGVDTPLSPWVKLEIETFLELHGPAARSRILTILASGEPAVSFPPILLDQETGGAEPFAVDIRGEDLRQIRKNLRGDPFLRLASAMLDRPFDALKQREKIFVLQRIAAVAGVCLLVTTAFAAYAVNRADLIAAQSARIQEEYENALINESMLLAEQSEKRLKDNDPLEAMALARAALPSADQQRPVVTEAEYALGKALGIYITPSAAKGTATAVGMIDPEHDHFFLNDTGSLLFTWRSYEKGVQVWDTETLTPVQTLLPNEYIGHTSGELLLPEQNALIFRLFNRIVSVDCLTGEQNWSFETERTTLAVCLSDDRKRVVLLSEQEDAAGKSTYLDILSAATGAPERTVAFTMDPDHEAGLRLVLSPDLKWAAVPAMDRRDGWLSEDAIWYCLYLVDLETGGCEELLNTDAEILAIKFEEDRLAVAREWDHSLISTYGNTLVTYTEPASLKIELYDPESGRLLWCSQHQHHLWDDGICAVKMVPYDTGTDTGKGLIAICSNLCVLLDWETGRVVREYELQGAALDVQYGGNGFQTLNADGSSSATDYTLEQMRAIQYFDGSISAVCRHQDEFYVQSSPAFSQDDPIRKYKLGKYDETYIKLFDAQLLDWGYYDYRCAKDGVRMVLARDHQICYMDSGDNTVRTWEIPEERGFSPFRVYGLSPDARLLYWHSENDGAESAWITGGALWATDLLTGDTRQIPTPAKPEEYVYVAEITYFEGSLFFAATISGDSGSELGLYRWRLSDGELEELCRYTLASSEDLGDGGQECWWEDYLYGSLRLDEETEQLRFATTIRGLDQEKPGSLYLLELSGKETARIDLAFGPDAGEEDLSPWEPYCYQWSPDGTKALIGYGDHVYLIGSEGELLFRVPAEGYDPVAFFLPDGESLMVLTEDLVLSQYRVSDGICQTSIDLNDHLQTSLYDRDEVQLVRVDENTAALFTGSDGFVLDISGDLIKIKALIDQGIGYDGETDCFLVAEVDFHSGETATIGKFRRYGLDALTQKADAILGLQK